MYVGSDKYALLFGGVSSSFVNHNNTWKYA